MATQRKTAAQRRAEAEAEAAPAAEAQPAEAAPQQPNGVFIEKAATDDGKLQVNVAPVGGVQVTEVQTLIELGLRTFRDQIGLGQSRG